ncbi:efflux RND transporter periplasmic adaptor subunit [Microbacterium ulmi]|uniref:Biotin/lipoyl-binding protein n=1 Tax=Microbacterium ulmi TaxID=179095 RepID=A0A7Y2Q136_9MICO|nr:biotin/lipoyl-binding protein [Microbacterium ulmi]NII70411.1 multidrug efflux pump subunit AcrA (membrane-fusion protein) [Microbacterium ulmi]NNH04988.1 biotin/lipoyl-binding protein [Microbacterium ulmi]
MVVWRRWIFPILMVLVFGAIAAALVKIAFFADPPEAALEPTARIADTVVAVERGEVVNALSLTGTIARDESFPIRSEIDGTVTAVHVGEGQSVAAGQALFTITQTYPVKKFDVVAPEAGDVSELAVVKGQATAVGAELVKLTPARFHVLSTVEPVQLYRLLNAPSEASVSIQGGPAPFTCTGLKVQVADDGTTSVRCAVPAEQVVFAGLQAQLDINIGTVSDALVVPTTAVKGGAESGIVWVDAGDGAEPVERTIALGVSDGTVVQVTEGLEEGEQIRQFVPGLAAANEPVCYDDGMGGQYCEPQGWSW